MSDPVTRLNAALEGRYAIERELGEGGMALGVGRLRSGNPAVLPRTIRPGLRTAPSAQNGWMESMTIRHPYFTATSGAVSSTRRASSAVASSPLKRNR